MLEKCSTLTLEKVYMILFDMCKSEFEDLRAEKVLRTSPVTPGTLPNVGLDPRLGTNALLHLNLNSSVRWHEGHFQSHGILARLIFDLEPIRGMKHVTVHLNSSLKCVFWRHFRREIDHVKMLRSPLISTYLTFRSPCSTSEKKKKLVTTWLHLWLFCSSTAR